MNRIFEIGSWMFLNLKFRVFEFSNQIHQLANQKIRVSKSTLRLPSSTLNSIGFTLVEILVAISILAVIGAVSIPNLRGFNENQILINTTNDLVRVLKEAQSSANSHIQCSNTLIAKEWVVETGGNSYILKVNCYDPTLAASPAPITTETRYTPAAGVTNGVTIATGTQHGLNCNVIFSAEYKPYDQNRFSNITFVCNPLTPALPADNVMEITLSKTGLDAQYICIDKGGAIYAAGTTACF